MSIWQKSITFAAFFGIQSKLAKFLLMCHYIVTSIDMKLNPFNKNKKNKDMNPKEKEAEKELNSQETCLLYTSDAADE